MKTSIPTFLIAILSILFFSTCTKIEAPLQLKVSPDSLVIFDSDTLKELFLSTQPGGTTMFQIIAKPDWLTVEPMSGSIDKDIASLKIKAISDSLVIGVRSGKIKIQTDNAGTIELPVSASIKGYPRIKTNLTSLSFPENISESEFIIENKGFGYLSWSIDSLPAWLTFSCRYGYLFPGEQIKLRAICNRSNLDQKTYTGSFTISSNSIEKIKPITVSMVVPRIAAMKLTNKNVLFDYFSDSEVVCLKNTGNTAVNWNAPRDNYYTFYPGSGMIAKGDSMMIRINLDRSLLKNGTYTSPVLFTGSDNVKDTLFTRINHFVGTKWFLDRNIIDAEFCRSTNKIVALSTDPYRLSVIDPETKSIQSVSLSNPPTTLAVNQKGDHAVIAQKNIISIVNLETMTIEKQISISRVIKDIVLTNSNWVYVLASSGGVPLSCINMQTGLETFSMGGLFSFGGMIRLNPTEKSIYTADTGVSPSDIGKYSIENGTAVYLYDSPYHGDYLMNGDLWFSEDGDRIITRGNTVLTSNPVKANDMIYCGLIANNPYNKYNIGIASLFHSKTANQIFYTTNVYDAPSDTYGCDVFAYSLNTLTYLNRYRLEKFLVPVGKTGGKLCDPIGRFVFGNKSGSKLYVLTQAEAKSGLLYDWAIQYIDVQ